MDQLTIKEHRIQDLINKSEDSNIIEAFEDYKIQIRNDLKEILIDIKKQSKEKLSQYTINNHLSPLLCVIEMHSKVCNKDDEQLVNLAKNSINALARRDICEI